MRELNYIRMLEHSLNTINNIVRIAKYASEDKSYLDQLNKIEKLFTKTGHLKPLKTEKNIITFIEAMITLVEKIEDFCLEKELPNFYITEIHKELNKLLTD